MFVIRHGFIPGLFMSVNSPTFQNLYVASAVLGGGFGAINGLLFGVLVLATERNRSVDEVRTRRFIALGAVASAGVTGLLCGNAWVALAASIVGGTSSAATLWIARRATMRALPSTPGVQELRRGAT